MKHETKLKVENLMFNMQASLDALDELKKDGFYSNLIKYYMNRLTEEILKLYRKSFENSTVKGSDYYHRLNEFQKIGLVTFEKFDKLSEEGKIKYLYALANFNTINLREK